MATSRIIVLALMCASAPAWSREAASPTECQAVSSQPAITSALAKAARNPDDLPARFALADAWSDAGCFNDAVNVLQSAAAAHPENIELQTRLRVAKSLVGEEHFFEDLDRADTQAKLKRAAFRCQTLSDLDACGEALRMKPDDPTLLVAQGDALLHAKRPNEALVRYRRAETLTLDTLGMAEKIRSAEAELSQAPNEARGSTAAVAAPDARVAQTVPPPANPRHYSNASPEAQSH